MTRTFILYSHATTNPNFELDTLFEAGRMDLVCRCVLAALWLSKHVRNDTQFIVCLTGGPKPPVSIRFDGSKLVGINPSERNVALVIKKCLFKARDKEWTSVQEGVFASRKSFQDLVKDASNIYVLDARGESISKVKLNSPTFILGDHVGLPHNEIAIALRKGRKVSLGNQIYLASSVISVVNWVMDK